jgi:hypothetical protein
MFYPRCDAAPFDVATRPGVKLLRWTAAVDETKVQLPAPYGSLTVCDEIAR